MKSSRFLLLLVPLVFSQASRSAAQDDSPIPHPGVDVSYVTPANYNPVVHTQIVKGTTVNFGVTFYLFPSPTDAIDFFGNLTINGEEPTINGKKSGPVELRVLPIGFPNSGAAYGTQTWSATITGPRDLFAEVHFTGVGYLTNQNFDFYDQTFQYEVTCNPQDFVISRFFQRLFHRCY